MWSPAMWSLNGDHIADTTFLYKIVVSKKPTNNPSDQNQMYSIW